MDTVNDRIKQIRTHFGLTQREFSKQISMGQSSLGEIETGVRKVNDRVIQLISSIFNVSKEWLNNGKGEMFIKEKSEIGLDHLIEIYRQLDEPLQKYLLSQTENLLKFHNEYEIKKK